MQTNTASASLTTSEEIYFPALEQGGGFDLALHLAADRIRGDLPLTDRVRVCEEKRSDYKSRGYKRRGYKRREESMRVFAPRGKSLHR